MTRALPARVGDEPADGVELLVARVDQEALARLAALLVLLLHLVDELAHEIEHAVPRPGLLPQIARGVALPRGRHGRIAGPAELPWLKGRKRVRGPASSVVT